MPSLVDYDCDRCGADLRSVTDGNDPHCPQCHAPVSPLKFRATKIDYFGRICAGLGAVFGVVVTILCIPFSHWIPWSEGASIERLIFDIVCIGVASGVGFYGISFAIAVYLITGFAELAPRVLYEALILAFVVYALLLGLIGLSWIAGPQIAMIAGIVVIGGMVQALWRVMQ